jgi:hypothetical protein
MSTTDRDALHAYLRQQLRRICTLPPHDADREWDRLAAEHATPPAEASR